MKISMKRWLKCLLLPLVVGALIVGLCGSSFAKTKDGKWLIVWVSGNVYGDWTAPVKKGMKDAAELFGNVEWRWMGPTDNDVAKIINTQWAAVNDPEVDGIVTDIYDPIAHEDVIQAAYDNGIALVTVWGDEPDAPRL